MSRPVTRTGQFFAHWLSENGGAVCAGEQCSPYDFFGKPFRETLANICGNRYNTKRQKESR